MRWIASWLGRRFSRSPAKYKGDAQAPAKLKRKVKDGGCGVWGVIPMPAHPSMSDADIRTVVGLGAGGRAVEIRCCLRRLWGLVRR